MEQNETVDGEKEKISLYRFLTVDSAIKSLENGNLRIGRILEFNDPFEMRPAVTGVDPEDESIRDFHIDVYRRDVDRDWGVICFSREEVVHDPVVWSHYSDHHRGIAFEFVFSANCPGLIHVNYDQPRPKIDVREMNQFRRGDGKFDGEAYRDWLRPINDALWKTKASSWSYEKEVRWVFQLEDYETSGGAYFADLQKEGFLKRVILGAECSDDIAYIERTIRNCGYVGVDVVKASFHPEIFRVEC